MKDYSVLLKKTDGTEDVITISAENENDARWAGKKMQDIYDATVLKRVNTQQHPHSNKGYTSLDAARKKAFTCKE